MIRKLFAVLGGVLVMASLAQAQAPSFRWQKGQVLVYRTEHNTLASYVLDDNKSAVKTSVQSLRRWQVLDVDAAGVATLQLSITALRYEAVPEGSEPTVYDSAQPEKSSEQMRKQFSYIGQPLAVLRIDPQGKVLEVKEARSGFASAAKFESDPAFKMVLPAAALTAGQTWARDYQITLEPPQGTGEKFAAVQRYSCKSLADNLATVMMTTEVKNPPAAQDDQVPLWQMQPEGEFVFDVQAGRLQKATLKIDKEAKLANGGSRFQSIYSEQYAGDR